MYKTMPLIESRYTFRISRAEATYNGLKLSIYCENSQQQGLLYFFFNVKDRSNNDYYRRRRGEEAAEKLRYLLCRLSSLTVEQLDVLFSSTNTQDLVTAINRAEKVPCTGLLRYDVKWRTEVTADPSVKDEYTLHQWELWEVDKVTDREERRKLARALRANANAWFIRTYGKQVPEYLPKLLKLEQLIDKNN